jgi:hypothetical protein
MSDKSKFAPANTSASSKVVIERTYRARAEELWDLWTTKDGNEDEIFAAATDKRYRRGCVAWITNAPTP